MMKVNEPMLVLELFLRGSDGKELERVVIEMNKLEAKAFAAKLKDIEKVRLNIYISIALGSHWQFNSALRL